MKPTIAATILIFLLLTGVAAAFYDGHVYINGMVESVDGDSITISGVHYRIDERCTVVIQYEESGSFHERRGQRSDVSTGETVTARMTGGVLYEIMIERWRR